MNILNNIETNATNLKDIYGSNLKLALKASGMTIEEFAEKVDVSPRMVYDWLWGIKLPRLERAIVISCVLGVSIESLAKPRKKAGLSNK